MLKLVNIVKDYPMKDQEPVHALKGLTVNFRKNEFVSILGPSGCGKTTLLNIIGGLDRYTSGDLIIEGKSTKDYKDGDWDTYRNHSIGFVFQSYNLIPHQTIIKNVELALTIGGVSKEERRERALKALEKVGLQGLEKKKPNQLSGGQMQRVAIARALINEPEILLADEPTGALDSETSIQVMDLLKEVAKNCLVIMVTHNPDLAERYSSRIIKMKDGVLLSDTNPYDGEPIEVYNPEDYEEVEEYEVEVNHGEESNSPKKGDGEPDLVVNEPIYVQHFNGGTLYKNYSPFKDNNGKEVVESTSEPSITVKKTVKKVKKPSVEPQPATKKDKANKGNKKNSSMSFFTATSLSLSNLFSKFRRTLLIAIAGSIGIIGVSAVLAVSNGVHEYINEMQNDMISQYPISVAETAVDYTSLLTGLSNDDKRKIVDFAKEYEVGLDSLIDYLMDKYKDFTSVKTNDINDDLIEYIESMPKEYVSSINKNYGLDVTNNIFTKWKRDDESSAEFISLNGLTQMYIAELTTVEGFSEYATFVDLFTDFMKEIPGEEDYILEQYDIVAGEYPKSANDVVVVVDENQTLTDLIYAQMGFFSETEFINISRKALEEHSENPDPEKIAKYSYPTSYKFEDILGKELKYYPHDSIWEYQTLSEDILKFTTTLPLQGQNYDIQFRFKHDPVTDFLSGLIIAEGYNIKSNYFRSDDVKDPDNPFIGNWEGRISTILGSLDLKFTITDTKVILHFDNPMEYQEVEEPGVTHVKFNFDTGSGPMPFDFIYDSVQDQLNLGGYFTLDRNPETPKDNAHPILGRWSGDVMGSNLDFTLNDGGEMIYHAHVLNSYERILDATTAYMYEAFAQDSWENGVDMRISAILKKKDGVNFGCLDRGVYYTRAMTQKMIKDSKNSNIVAGDHSIENYIGSSNEQDRAYSAYVKYKYTSYLKGDGDKAVKNVDGYSNALNTDFSSSLGSMLSIRGSSNFSLDNAYLRSLSGLATKEVTFEGEVISYDFKELPQSISIYPKDFTKKKDVVAHLKNWNSNDDITLDSGKVLTPEDRHELTYTDTVEIIVAVINTLINVITIALVSFTSLALVVSCFMIAVITYISTMERVKEIGVIRSLGGRKKDVSRLFIAECLIIGLGSGLIGIGVTYLIQLIINIIITNSGVGITVIADLPFYTALIMIALSIFLNVISGLIPSMKASNQDPVAALRSE